MTTTTTSNKIKTTISSIIEDIHTEALSRADMHWNAGDCGGWEHTYNANGLNLGVIIPRFSPEDGHEVYTNMDISRVYVKTKRQFAALIQSLLRGSETLEGIQY